ncbi:hypothetical protein [Cytobacillus horneckiae]|uniref:hypothetical protein n=1 Tax=Cytobacillus horneckiae TaxID=549687 RepID=UPI003D9A4087
MDIESEEILTTKDLFEGKLLFFKSVSLEAILPTSFYLANSKEFIKAEESAWSERNTDIYTTKPNSFEFDPSQSYSGKGSFKTNRQNGTLQNDELIPINPSVTYRLSMMYKGLGVGGKNYMGTVAYDIDRHVISAHTFLGSQYPIGELARDLKKGDTVIYLKDSSVFIDDNETAE